MFYASVALSAASILGVALVGRLTPLPRGLSSADAAARAAAAYRGARLRQMVAAELPALLALACSFVAHSAVPYLISGTVAVILMAAFVIPTRARVAAAQRQLDRDGAASRLEHVLS